MGTVCRAPSLGICDIIRRMRKLSENLLNWAWHIRSLVLLFSIVGCRIVAILMLVGWCGDSLALGLEWLPGKGAPNWFSASEDNERDILVFLHADRLMTGESIVWDDCFNARVTFEGLSNICARIGQKTQLENLRFFYLSPTKLANLDVSFLSCVTNLHLLQVVAKSKTKISNTTWQYIQR